MCVLYLLFTELKGSYIFLWWPVSVIKCVLELVKLSLVLLSIVKLWLSFQLFFFKPAKKYIIKYILFNLMSSQRKNGLHSMAEIKINYLDFLYVFLVFISDECNSLRIHVK